MNSRLPGGRGASAVASSTSPLEAAHVWFPLHPKTKTPSGILVQIAYEEADRVITPMAQARELTEREEGPEELVFRESFAVAQFDSRAHGAEEAPLHSLPDDHGRAVHPSVRSQFSHTGMGVPLWLHTDGCFFGLTGTLAGESFETYQALHSEIMLSALATCVEEAASGVFRGLASLDAWTAVEVLEGELVLFGDSEVVRLITPLLQPADILPLLEYAHDFEVRERALANLGKLGRG